MKLISMKRKPEEKTKDTECCDSPHGEHPDFPWGLRINLAEEQLDALGIKSLPVAGAKVALEGVALVYSVGEETVDGGKTSRRLELQITDLALAAAGTSKYAAMYADDPSMKD